MTGIGKELDPTGIIADGEEDELSKRATQHHPARDGHFLAGLRLGFESGMGRSYVGGKGRPLEPIGKVVAHEARLRA
jgi:hypothetical protein